MGPKIFLIFQGCLYGILGITNFLFTKRRLEYVFGPKYNITPVDIFWQRDIGIFQLAMAIVSIYSSVEDVSTMKVAFATLGSLWGMGTLFLAYTTLFNKEVHGIVSTKSGLGIAAVSTVLALLNGYFWLAIK